MKITNPILPGFYPDPSICKANGKYYLATSSFEYFPGVPLLESEDLMNWRQIGHCLIRSSQLPLEDTVTPYGIWAPTLRYHEGVFYMITTNSGSGGHFYVTTSDIYGSWSEPIWIEGAGHDPDLFFDPSGKVYFSRFNGYKGITLWEIDLPTGKLISEPYYIFQGFEDPLCEAPHIYYIDDYYYLLAAEGGTWTGHMITAARSRNITGPYESCPHNPILTSRHLVMSPIQATGHGDLVADDQGNWWMVFLGTREIKRMQILGRETFLAPVHFENGWPVVNHHQPITLPAPQEISGVVTYEPKDNTMPFDLVYRRNPGNHVTTHGQQYIFTPSMNTLRSISGSTALLLWRQKHQTCQSGVQLSFSPNEGEEAGLCVYMNQDFYYCIYLTKKGQQAYLQVCKQIGDNTIMTAAIPWDKKEVRLSIVHADQTYHLGYLEDEQFQPLASGLSRLISSDLANTFTGMFFGIYATTKDASSENKAVFEDIGYTYEEGFTQGKKSWTE